MRFTLFFILITFTTLFSRDLVDIGEYNRAKSYLWQSRADKVFNSYIRVNFLPDSSGIWYSLRSSDGKRFKIVTFDDNSITDLFDHKRVAEILNDSLNIGATEEDLKVLAIDCLSSDTIIFTIGDKNYSYSISDHNLTPFTKEKEEEERDWNRSPDGRYLAYLKDYNLYIEDSKSGVKSALSTDGKQGYEYGNWLGWSDLIEGESSKLGSNFWVSWSDSSSWLYSNICDYRSAKKMYLLDYSIDSLYRPKLLSYYRGSPGDTAITYYKPNFFNIKTGKRVEPDLPRVTHINPIEFDWSSEDGVVYLKYTARGFQEIKIYRFDLNSEKLDLLYSENSETNIDNFQYEIVEGGGKIFILSERDGWRKLYSVDLQSKQLKPLIEKQIYINEIIKIDEDREIIYFMGSGRVEGKNPYYQDLYSISFGGGNLNQLTDEGCNHIVKLSPCGRYFMDNYSTINIKNRGVVRDLSSGEILVTLGETKVEYDGWQPPEIFTSQSHDGKFTTYGAVWKPSNFDESKTYPIIENSYTGPHTQMFPINFYSGFYNQSLAELGFLVVQVDGVGSSGRSKEFHNYSYKNLGNNLLDHTIWLKDLCRTYSWADSSRIGIFGHSAGGYDAAHALLQFPDIYKVGVASSGDHDHRMEKAWWPEMYMGWPVDSLYHQQSNITLAGKLEGKLLLIHGGLDENVNPSATYKLAEALIKADKDFDMLIIPSQRHNYEGEYYTYYRKKMWNYFISHLQGRVPLWDY